MDCYSCKNARCVISESGSHLVCALPTRESNKCIKGIKSYYAHTNETFIDGLNVVTKPIFDGTF